jgi:hypothetical protein
MSAPFKIDLFWINCSACCHSASWDWTVLSALVFRRLLWGAVCIVCLTVAVIMMKIVWLRFNESPTVTNVETTTYPIWNIPFPAVTLCNNNKVYRPAAIKLAESLWVLLMAHSFFNTMQYVPFPLTSTDSLFCLYIALMCFNDSQNKKWSLFVNRIRWLIFVTDVVCFLRSRNRIFK